MDDIDDLTLAIHDNHGYINTHYSDRGNNRLTFPTQTLGGKVERESRYEIATVLVDRLSSDECLTNPELKDNYCLEKNVAETLNCSIPGIDFEGKNDERKRYIFKNSNMTKKHFRLIFSRRMCWRQFRFAILDA